MFRSKQYASTKDLPGALRLFPLTGVLLLPRGELPLNIFEPRYLAMVDQAIAGDRMIGMVQPLPGEQVGDPRLYAVGCAGRLTHFSETGDGRYIITLSGVSRFRIIAELPVETPFRSANVVYEDFAHDLEPGAGEDAVDRVRMTGMLRKFAQSAKLEVDWASVDAAPTETLVNALAMMCPFGPQEKQSLLEAVDLKTRAEILIGLAQFDLARGEHAAPNKERPQFH